jgi:hypothetical protein
VGRPKSSPEHREAKKAAKREADRNRVREKRQARKAERAAQGQPASKRGRPRDPRMDVVSCWLAMARLCAHKVEPDGTVTSLQKRGGVTVLAADLAREFKVPVKPGEVSLEIHRIKKARKR